MATDAPKDKYTRTLLQSAGLYAEQFGWKLVALHGFDDGQCTCRKGGDCPSPAKHPILKDWKGSATSNSAEIVERMTNHPAGNLGLLLGPESGVIDIEFDCDQGRKSAEKLFGDIDTPTYSSGRSVHRLFRWNARLPDVQKLTPKTGPLAGLEIRIGNGEKSTQSVLPPSRHYSGAEYKWLPGLAAGPVEPAELPRDILAMIVNYDPAAGGAATSGRGLDIVKQDAIVEGGRNETLFKFACWHAGRSANIASGDEQQMIFSQVLAMNIAKCQPPLPESEVRTLVDSAIFAERSGKQRRGEEVKAEDLPDTVRPCSYGAMGIDYDDSRNTYHPGNWRLQVVLADPVYYRLVVPAFCPLTPRKDGAVEIPTALIDRAGDVARLIRQATNGQAVVNPFPGEWEVIWKGRKKGKKDPGCEGLFSQLIAAAETVDGSFFDKRWISVAEFLLGKLLGAYNASKKTIGDKEIEQVPDKDVPTRFSNGDVYFCWQTVFIDGLNKKLFTEDDLKKLRERLRIAEDNKSKVVKLAGGGTSRLVILSDEDIKALQDSIYYDSEQDDTPF